MVKPSSSIYKYLYNIFAKLLHMSQIPIILKPSLRESDIKTGTAGIEIIITYSGPPTAQEKKQFTADKLLSVIKEMGPSPELANSIKKEMGWRRKVKIRTANL